MSLYENLLDKLEGHPYSGYFYCSCPLPSHADESPSFCVWEDLDKPEGEGRFKCQGCGASGTHKYLWKIVTGGDARLPVMQEKKQKFLPKWKRWEERFGSLENLVEYANANVRSGNSIYTWYFKKRNLMELVDKCTLGAADGWALFPVFERDGKLVDVVCRNTQKIGDSKYIIRPDEGRETPNIYVPSWMRLTQSQTVYIVYGIVDALAIELCGLPVITGTTGKSLSNKRLMNLRKHYVIIPDRYEETDAYNLSHDLGMFSRVKHLSYELDEKDPDDIRMHRGVEILRNLITEE